MNTIQRQDLPNRLHAPSRSLTLRALGGILALVVASSIQAQDDLPFSSGSTGADGALEIPRHPTAREGAFMGYDQTNNQLVVFGGHFNSTYYPETWVSDDPAVGWDKLETETFVSARSSGNLAWDYVNQTLLLFGGYRADGTVLGDTWSWDGEDWTQLEPAASPPARYYHSLVSDPVSKKIYLLGGRSSANANLDDLWEWNGTTWTQLEDIGVPPVNDYNYFEAVYDESDASILAFNTWRRRTWRFKNGAWSEIATATSPNLGWGASLVYDVAGQSSLLFGGTSHTGQTWEFRENEWIQLTPETTPGRRYDHSAAYDTENDRVVITLGWMDYYHNTVSNVYNFDTYTFESDNWMRQSGRYYYFDMSEHEDGIWNFTSINVPSSAEVVFLKNASNSPLVWLATESVAIDGILRLDGEDAAVNEGADNYARGGPGGATGGLGGIRFDVSGNYAGTPGQGAGGGAPGVTSGEYGSPGNFRETYGNSLLLPLIGGSGGGGGASNAGTNGGHGGGGGGAILIASSKDITVNGTINADGGTYRWSGTSYGGRGSGGAIKLMADRVLGSGKLWARGGRSLTDNAGGRIRIEAFFRPLTPNASPVAVATAPIATPDFGALPTLSIVSVEGENVASPPSGNLQTPDVVFTAAGTVTIVVDSENVPAGTPVTLRITSSGSIITLPEAEAADVTVAADGTATFSATVPAGLGTIQAFTEFTP